MQDADDFDPIILVVEELVDWVEGMLRERREGCSYSISISYYLINDYSISSMSWVYIF